MENSVSASVLARILPSREPQRSQKISQGDFTMSQLPTVRKPQVIILDADRREEEDAREILLRPLSHMQMVTELTKAADDELGDLYISAMQESSRALDLGEQVWESRSSENPSPAQKRMRQNLEDQYTEEVVTLNKEAGRTIVEIAAGKKLSSRNRQGLGAWLSDNLGL